MPRAYNESLILCPFYKSIATQSISCEGINDNCTTKLLFTSADKMNMHRKEFCECKYKLCKIYSLLEKKYE